MIQIDVDTVQRVDGSRVYQLQITEFGKPVLYKEFRSKSGVDMYLHRLDMAINKWQFSKDKYKSRDII